jgi:NNP family nitrate/nitrite transporter-like MFS transporter
MSDLIGLFTQSAVSTKQYTFSMGDGNVFRFIGKKATSIKLFNFSAPAMRAFHMSWLAFFVCFFAWFACAPLMPVIAGEFHLTKDQIANINIAAVAITILVRLIVGPLCDKYGPRKTYTALLIIGSIPVFGVASANSYESFLFFRLLIGAIGASFVITQYHTSIMFAPNVVGTANAASAGWGNAGGGQHKHSCRYYYLHW